MSSSIFMFTLVGLYAVDMKQVQLWMGHSDFSTTADIYAHLAPGALVESAGVLGSLLGEEPVEMTSEN